MKYVTIIIALTALCFLACKNETKVDNIPTEKTDINSVYIKTVPIENGRGISDECTRYYL